MVRIESQEVVANEIWPQPKGLYAKLMIKLIKDYIYTIPLVTMVILFVTTCTGNYAIL